MQSGLIYHGDIRFYLINSDKTIEIDMHNQGEDQLFKSFALFLSQMALESVSTPVKLDVCKVSGANYESIINSPVSIFKSYTYQEEKSIHMCVIDSFITYTDFKVGTAIDASTTYCVRLLDANGIGLAYSKIEASALQQVVPGTEGRVLWSLYLTNNT